MTIGRCLRALGIPLTAVLVLIGCSSGGSSGSDRPQSSGSTRSQQDGRSPAGDTTSPGRGNRPPALEVSEVATGLDTVWSLDWDPQGRLWYTERPGRLSRLNGPTTRIDGVVEDGEGGLMGLEIDARGRFFLMYTAGDENRIVRLGEDGSQTVLVDGIPAGFIHDGGRLRFGPNGKLYASTGETGNDSLAQDPTTLAGKILEIDPDSGAVDIYSTGHRNAQGLCFTPAGRFLSTEHGPDFGDEINVLTRGSNGGWPEVSGNGIKNYTPTIAPAGCTVYSAELIPQWKESMLFVTLKDSSLRRLTFADDGSVAGEQVLFAGRFGRLRDVAVGPDGAVYLATSNRDGRGEPLPGDDKILRVAPAH